MALETFKGVEDLDGEQVIIMDELREKYPERFNESGSMDYDWFEKVIRPHHFIYIRHDKNSLSFTLQNGPVKEVGKNGCQVDHVIMAAKTILEGLNKNFPCRENAMAITKLDEALHWLDHRKKARAKAGVEGFNKAIPEKKPVLAVLKFSYYLGVECYSVELCPYKAPEQIENVVRFIKSLGVTAHRVTERHPEGKNILIVSTTDQEKLLKIDSVIVSERLAK